MNANFVSICLFYALFHLLTGQDAMSQTTEKPDYLASGYYQLIYEADLAYLEGNDDLALEKIEKAKECCPLLNQYIYQETNVYSSLLLRKRRFAEAMNYMDRLVTEYGEVPHHILKDLNKDSLLKNDLLTEYPDFFEKMLPDVFSRYANYYHQPERVSLIETLSEILKKDQDVRNDSGFWKDPTRSEEERAARSQKESEVDAQNLEQLYLLFDQYGFPDMQQIGAKNFQLYTENRVVLIHNSHEKELQERLLQYIRDGKCSPGTYAVVMDHENLRTHQQAIYGIYANKPDDLIADIEHLDERRISIGLPTREMEKKRKVLMER